MHIIRIQFGAFKAEGSGFNCTTAIKSALGRFMRHELPEPQQAAVNRAVRNMQHLKRGRYGWTKIRSENDTEWQAQVIVELERI
jgi:hypothetical protein